jgi:hypothetical protein
MKVSLFQVVVGRHHAYYTACCTHSCVMEVYLDKGQAIYIYISLKAHRKCSTNKRCLYISVDNQANCPELLVPILFETAFI